MFIYEYDLSRRINQVESFCLEPHVLSEKKEDRLVIRAGVLNLLELADHY
jgi:hypothetical protein